MMSNVLAAFKFNIYNCTKDVLVSRLDVYSAMQCIAI